MKTRTPSPLRTALLAITATAGLCVDAPRTQRPLGESPLVVQPSSRAVTFEQIDFAYENVSLRNSDWGQVVVDPAALRRLTGRASGYVNVFMPPRPGSDRRLPHWSVENLSIPRAANAPVTRRFDLRPGQEGTSKVIGLVVLAVFTTEPLPAARGVLSAVSDVPPQRFPVSSVTVNGEGSNSEQRAITAFTLAHVSPMFVLGQPPQPVLPPFEPKLTFHAPVGVYQSDGPNVEQARNQCVPAAYANVLQYLENRYRLSRNWSLQHDHVPGFGQLSGCGGFIHELQLVWSPVPANSLVANICALSRRAGTCSCSTGSGTSSSGFFRYLAQFGQNAPVELRHQGGSGNTTIEGITSTQVGEAPTWGWIRGELEAGRGVYISYCRYDDVGARTGGHALRVWGAEAYNGKRYLLCIDDGNQGCNVSGAQTRQLEVADIGRPGGGPPNGILNLNGLDSRELTGARSVRALQNGSITIGLGR